MTTSQFFVYQRPIAWTALVATLLWGVYAYLSMPQRHDPEHPGRNGRDRDGLSRRRAEKVEQEVTRKIEKKVSENPAVERVHSISRQGLSVVFVELRDEIRQADPDLGGSSDQAAEHDRSAACGRPPLVPRLDKDFGDTVAVMLTITSPPVSDFEIEQRAESIRKRWPRLGPRGPPSIAANRVYGGAGLSQDGRPLYVLWIGNNLGAIADQGPGRGRGHGRAAQHRLPRFPAAGGTTDEDVHRECSPGNATRSAPAWPIRTSGQASWSRTWRNSPLCCGATRISPTAPIATATASCGSLPT